MRTPFILSLLCVSGLAYGAIGTFRTEHSTNAINVKVDKAEQLLNEHLLEGGNAEMGLQASRDVQETLHTIMDAVLPFYYEVSYFPYSAKYNASKFIAQTSKVTTAFGNATAVIKANTPLNDESFRTWFPGAVKTLVYADFKETLDAIYTRKKDFADVGITPEIVLDTVKAWKKQTGPYHLAVLDIVGDKVDDELKQRAKDVEEWYAKVFEEYGVTSSHGSVLRLQNFWVSFKAVLAL